MLLNFSDRTRTGAFSMIWPLAEDLCQKRATYTFWIRKKIDWCKITKMGAPFFGACGGLLADLDLFALHLVIYLLIYLANYYIC